jgi:hypothetical protein
MSSTTELDLGVTTNNLLVVSNVMLSKKKGPTSLTFKHEKMNNLNSEII